MTYTISRNGEYLYVSRKPTEKERIRFISNGYNPPDLVREPKASVYQYIRGELPPNYPMPAMVLQVVHAYDPDDGVFGEVHYVVIENYTTNKGSFFWPDGEVQWNVPFV